MSSFFHLIGYIGPDTAMPLASGLAAAVGLVLIFWQYVVAMCKRVVGYVRRKWP
jgi:hypothetical protein